MFAKDRYFETASAFDRKDKVDLMKYLSTPLYDVIKFSKWKIFRA